MKWDAGLPSVLRGFAGRQSLLKLQSPPDEDRMRDLLFHKRFLFALEPPNVERHTAHARDWIRENHPWI
jgi:hypothetical protein